MSKRGEDQAKDGPAPVLRIDQGDQDHADQKHGQQPVEPGCDGLMAAVDYRMDK